MIRIACFALSSSLLVLAGCSSSKDSPATGAKGGHTADTDSGASTSTDSGTVSEDFEATAADFKCIQEGTHVRKFFIRNALGHDAESLAVANAGQGTYPVGTMIQLVPQEAMVKRRAGFSAPSGDWEFFSLSPTAGGTDILARGTTDVLNLFNLNCLDCHVKAEPQYDFVCETGHGCDPLPLTTDQIVGLQNTDVRCPAADAGKM
ncbi:MAG TPA: hypothetical protein VH062_35260 [Polyangiaceae bacterium]|jgi:hypothetical protein|nr:hypothetical protein [Polyangiaceae bacterium]